MDQPRPVPEAYPQNSGEPGERLLPGGTPLDKRGEPADRKVVLPPRDEINPGPKPKCLLRHSRRMRPHQGDKGLRIAGLQRLSKGDIPINGGRAGIQDKEAAALRPLPDEREGLRLVERLRGRIQKFYAVPLLFRPDRRIDQPERVIERAALRHGRTPRLPGKLSVFRPKGRIDKIDLHSCLSSVRTPSALSL